MNKRIIKFRAWSKKDKKMLPWEVQELNYFLALPEKYELMQFTGLLDKNGKEIYEGDIIRAYWEGLSEKKISEVKYKLGGFDIKSNFMPSSDNLNCEVIGNIYENQDLLKGGV